MRRVWEVHPVMPRLNLNAKLCGGLLHCSDYRLKGWPVPLRLTIYEWHKVNGVAGDVARVDGFGLAGRQQLGLALFCAQALDYSEVTGAQL